MITVKIKPLALKADWVIVYKWKIVIENWYAKGTKLITEWRQL